MSPTSRVLLFAGTRKGAFIFESDADRQDWHVQGPHFPGWAIQHIKYDPRTGILYASLDHAVYGASIHYSEDLGQTWEMAEGPSFPEGDERTVQRVWHVQPGHASLRCQMFYRLPAYFQWVFIAVYQPVRIPVTE